MGNPKFARFAWITLAFTVAVVLWGAIVRATGSGAGCGETWPLCNGQLLFGTPVLAKVIEFAHRASTGIDAVLVAIMAVWAFRAFEKGHPARFGAVMTVVFLIVEALLGAVLVKFGLVVNDASPARAIVLSIHLANTLALLAAPALTALWGAGHPRVSWDLRAWATLAALAFLGISGALSALADTLWPATSLEAGLAQDWSPSAAPLLRLRAMHPLAAIAVALWLIWYASSRLGNARWPARAVIALVGAQITAGAINLALLAPVWMQVLHLLLADLLWIAVIALCESPPALVFSAGATNLLPETRT
jgi:heme a synthase